MQVNVSRAWMKPQEHGCKIDFILVAPLHARGVLLFICPRSSTLLVNMSNHDKADTWVVSCIQLSQHVILKTLCS